MLAWLSAELRRFGNTCQWSWQGVCATWLTEKSFRQWTLANAISASLAVWLPLSVSERAVILALGLLVLAAELLNTAIESVVNLVSSEPHPMAGKAKDCGSAGVALTAIAAGVAWGVILWGLWVG